jgi:hypothetical protein
MSFPGDITGMQPRRFGGVSHVWGFLSAVSGDTRARCALNDAAAKFTIEQRQQTQDLVGASLPGFEVPQLS